MVAKVKLMGFHPRLADAYVPLFLPLFLSTGTYKAPAAPGTSATGLSPGTGLQPAAAPAAAAAQQQQQQHQRRRLGR
jgi:hypothetical protein